MKEEARATLRTKEEARVRVARMRVARVWEREGEREEQEGEQMVTRGPSAGSTQALLEVWDHSPTVIRASTVWRLYAAVGSQSDSDTSQHGLEVVSSRTQHPWCSCGAWVRPNRAGVLPLENVGASVEQRELRAIVLDHGSQAGQGRR